MRGRDAGCPEEATKEKWLKTRRRADKNRVVGQGNARPGQGGCRGKQKELCPARTSPSQHNIDEVEEEKAAGRCHDGGT